MATWRESGRGTGMPDWIEIPEKTLARPCMLSGTRESTCTGREILQFSHRTVQQVKKIVTSYRILFFNLYRR